MVWRIHDLDFLTLTRQGMIAPGLYGQIDDITASFTGNRLSELRDDAPTVLLEASLDLPEGAWSERKLAETVYDAAGSLLSRRDYVGQFEFVADTLERTLLPEGFVTACDNVFHAYIPDYQGNIVGVYNSSTNTLEQFTDYYPYGLPHASATAPTANRRKYGAKELTADLGLNLYDFAARLHNPAFPAFTTMDPMASDYYPTSPYTYCSGDPVNLVDPSGMGTFWHNGKVIGSDGIDNDKIYVIRDANTLESSLNGGVSKDKVKSTVNFIKQHNKSNTQEEIASAQWVYDNCVMIEPSASNRQSMTDHVKQDNGNGGSDANNNREHGGYINNGVVVFEPSGEVADPTKNTSVSISITSGYPSFHSHPSGTKPSSSPSSPRGFQSYSTTTLSGVPTDNRGFIQVPSSDDINNAGNHICYVFAMADQKVYIYNSNGVQAVIPIKYFVTPKK